VLDSLEATTPTVNAAARRSLALVLGALFVGTVMAVDPSGLVPSGPLRWTVTWALMGAAVCVLLLQPVMRNPPRISRNSSLGQVGPGVMLVGLVGWLFLAAIFGADSLHAWIGTPDRRLGVLAWLTFPLLYLCGRSITGVPDRRVVLRGAALAAVVLGGWCAFERAGWSLIDETFAGHRVGGPFGQPAYVGAIAVLLAPLSFGVAFDRGGSCAWRIVGAFGALGAGAALLLSQTRGAWVGVLVALAMLAARHREVVAKRWRAGAAIAAAVVLLFVVSPFGGRVADAFDFGHGTTQGRFDDWAVGARVVERHPVLGVGPEGYRVVFPQVVSARYVQRYGTEVIPDRAHNGVIDVAANGGIVAGLLYALLLAMLLAVAWRSLRARDPLTLALACAVVAYIGQQMFLFPLSEVDPLFWVVAGILVATSASEAARPLRVSRALPVLVAVLVLFGIGMGAREVQADRLLERAARAPGATDLRDADHATGLRPDSIRTWYVAARIAARGEAITDVDAAVDRVQRGLDQSPRDPALRLLRADLLVERALRSGLEEDRARARAVVDEYVAGALHDPQLAADRAALDAARPSSQAGSPPAPEKS
jgi:O-antigen ligase